MREKESEEVEEEMSCICERYDKSGEGIYGKQLKTVIASYLNNLTIFSSLFLCACDL